MNININPTFSVRVRVVASASTYNSYATAGGLIEILSDGKYLLNFSATLHATALPSWAEFYVSFSSSPTARYFRSYYMDTLDNDHVEIVVNRPIIVTAGTTIEFLIKGTATLSLFDVEAALLKTSSNIL